MASQRRIILYSLVIYILGGTLLFANGNGESIEETQYTIAQARELIDQRDYNSAMAILVEIVRADPEQMEVAQRLIIQIRENRDSYNEKYQELMEVLFEQEDYQLSLEIIKELEELDPNPNQATENAIRDARISAELVYNRRVFNQIMDQALVFLDSERYYQAVQLYKTGFSLSRQTFDESDYDTVLKDGVYRSMESINQELDLLDPQWDSYLLNNQEFIALSAESDPESQQWQDRLDEIEALMTVREEIFVSARNLATQNRLISQNLDQEEEFYLSFMERLLTGRTTSGRQEGIVSSIDLYLDQNLNELSQWQENLWTQRNSQALEAYDLGQWQRAAELYRANLELCRQWDQMLMLNQRRIHLESNWELERLSITLNQPALEAYQKNRYRINDALVMISLSQESSRYEERLALFDDDSVSNWTQFRFELLQPLDSMEVLSQQLVNYLEPAAEPWLEQRDWETFNAVDQYDLLRNSILQLDSYSLAFVAQEELQPLLATYGEFQQRLILNGEYIEGFMPQADQNQLSVRYPQRAIQDLDLLELQMNQLLEQSIAYHQQYQEALQTVAFPEELTVQINENLELMERIRDDLLTIEEFNSQGENFIYLAQEDFNQGNFRFGNAERELSRFNFDMARSELEQANTLYVSALSYNEDIFSRDELTRRLEALGARILDEENQQVIREVRTLINQATADYFQGQYLRSEAALVRAENSWYRTNTEENNEIKYWMSLVRTALSIESGRSIDETNPLYRDVTQLYNLAYLSFEEGGEFLEENDRVRALSKLREANQYLNQILLLFPTNQASRVLKLKIQQLLDPPTAQETFRQMFLDAQRQINNNQEVDLAYLDLKDLQGVEPGYPGLSSLILEAEYVLGIRVRPPNPADLRESARLYQQALAIYQADNTLFFENAITQLDQALELNPQNSQAAELKDLMGAYVQPDRRIVIDPADLQLFQQAEELFVNRQYFEALSLVQQLLQNPANQNYAPLIELKRRIESNI